MTIFWVDDTGMLIKATPDDVTVDGATPVTIPPQSGKWQKWNGASWEDISGRVDQEADRRVTARFEGDKLNRLMFEIEFDQENRIRALEGKSALTKSTYRDALVARYKSLKK
jgi:hypothetical protein